MSIQLNTLQRNDRDFCEQLNNKGSTISLIDWHCCKL